MEMTFKRIRIGGGPATGGTYLYTAGRVPLADADDLSVANALCNWAVSRLKSRGEHPYDIEALRAEDAGEVYHALAARWAVVHPQPISEHADKVLNGHIMRAECIAGHMSRALARAEGRDAAAFPTRYGAPLGSTGRAR